MTGHMTPEEFRTYGRQAVDWVADYLERVESLPVLAPVSPGDVRDQLPAHPPEQPEPFEAVLADMQRVIVPGLTHWQHPSFFGYFPANASGPAILGDLLSSGLGTQGMLWATGPACTELETLVLDWFVELLGLPARFRSDGPGGGVIQDSSSGANLVALLAALHRASGGEAGHAGARRRYTVYTSNQAHSSVEKAVRMAGVGVDNLRLVDVAPDTQAIRVEHLQRLLADDLEAGATPVMVAATVGTTSTTAIDPVREIGRLCAERGVWLHVDAAYAGVAAVCPELRWINDGVAEYVDSYCTDPHKWLLTNFDCTTFWVADAAALTGALSVVPEYLRNAASESGAVIDYRDWQVPLGRRFRALKLWCVLRWYGAEGLREHIRTGVALAQELAGWIGQDERFEVVAPHPLGLVCFRLRGPDRLTEALLSKLNGGGAIRLTHTRVNGAFALRFAIGGVQTRRRHVEAAWKLIGDEAAALRSDG